ncbi:MULTISPECIES: hypothetical protein [Halorussus]|uniref:hypothetical protein n=1 Tax=Halorussus TaxID=1070314 RepID=UPI0013B4774D|nr:MULTISPECIES: hypothetical protein [Halorussus]NHN61425.1 hypothetical protein [Halorussus sp. JP-T4]
MNQATKLKSLSAVGAASVATALLFVAMNPAAGDYEITVYDAYTPAFWLLLLFAIFVGQLVIFGSRHDDDRRRFWKYGLLIVLAANLVILVIPALRYHLYARGDIITFIGMIRQIIDLQHVPRSNYYPNIHLLASTFSYVTGIEPQKVVNVLPPVMSIFYIVSTYALLNVLFADFRKVAFVLPFSSLLVLGYSQVQFHPGVFAFMLVPFLFFLVFRGYRGRSLYRYRLPLVVSVVAVAFYHPAVTVFFTGMLVLLKLALLGGRRFSVNVPTNETTSVVAASIAFVLFFSWYYSFESIIGSTLLIVYTLVGMSEGSSTFGHIAGVFGRTSPELADVALVGIYTYGFVGAIISMGGVFLCYYAYLVVRGRRQFDPIEAFLGGTFVVFSFGGVVAFFVDVTLGFNRIIRYARFAAIILIGSGLYTLFGRLDSETLTRYLRPIVFVSFFVFAFFSVFGLYGSPLDNEENNQITEAEVQGMQWVFNHWNQSLIIDQLGVEQYRMYTLQKGKSDPEGTIRWRAPPAPMHFNYTNVTAEDMPPEADPDRRYLVTTRLSRIKNPRFYPAYREYWRHTPGDFRRLGTDPTFAHVYDDGTLNAYIVRNVEYANESAVSSRTRPLPRGG